jgi:uncharacterized OsmC-like protein
MRYHRPVSPPSLAAALDRLKRIWLQRPAAALQEDAPATAHWQSGLAVRTLHPDGTSVVTDMPVALTGSGAHASPGWLMRAGVASCLSTCVVMTAAVRDIALTRLSVSVASRSDKRGMLGLRAADGTAIAAAPLRIDIEVTLAAHGAEPAALRALVEDSLRCSPVPSALDPAIPRSLNVVIEA